MARFWVAAVILSVCLVRAPQALAQDASADPDAATAQSAASAQSAAEERMSQIEALRWQKGPGAFAVAGNSTLQLPEGYEFLDKTDTAKFEELTHNLPGVNEVIVVPSSHHWVAYLDFDDAGKVKDDEKIDADKILAALRSGQEAQNEERRRRGWEPMTIAGWAMPPAYNQQTKRLEWATILEAGGSRNINFNTKILGRRGYTSVVLACSPQEQAAAIEELNRILTGYSFNSGERYADWVPGDKVAEYGLGALILGGTAVAAAKSGLLKGLFVALAAGWKFVLAGIAAIVAYLRTLFARKKAG